MNDLEIIKSQKISLILHPIESSKVQSKVIWLVLIGSLIVSSCITGLLLVSYFALNNTYVSTRIVECITVLLYLFIAVFFHKKGYEKIAAWMLVVLYMFASSLIIINWGINTPIGILMFGVVAVLTSSTLGSRFTIPITIIIISLLFLVQIANDLHIIQPDRSSFELNSTFGDVISYSAIFSVFTLLAWHSRRQLENSLTEALDSKFNLEMERNSLAHKVKEATDSLRRSQLQEMKQLYNFAELGQLTAVVLHELANHLSILTLDIDEISAKHTKSRSIEQAKESISYIDSTINKVRKQLKATIDEKRFDVTDLVKKAMDEMYRKSTKNNIKLVLDNKIRSRCMLFGDPDRLLHSITILLNNALDATNSERYQNSEVIISTEKRKNTILISIIDKGVGITKTRRDTLFIPRRSTKKNGMGIGLYISREIIKTHFKGNLYLDKRTDCTKFTIALPLDRASLDKQR